MINAVQVGIIGLGPRYAKRYKPALLRRRDRFTIRAVCDQVHERAFAEAKQLGCAAAAGAAELLERADVDALMLVDRQWHRLWPLELACRYSKPVFCCDTLECDDAHADAIHQRIQESKLPVMLAMTPRLAPATIQLRELLAVQLGPPRILLCDCTRPLHGAQPPGQNLACSLLGNPGSAVLDWCAWFLTGEPRSVRAAILGQGHLHSLLLEFSEDRGLQITCRRGPGLRAGMRLHVVAAKGSASGELPGRVSWSDGMAPS